MILVNFHLFLFENSRLILSYGMGISGFHLQKTLYHLCLWLKTGRPLIVGHILSPVTSKQLNSICSVPEFE
jgi:hypothetical protein